MTDSIMNFINGTGIAIALVSYLWVLLGAFRTSGMLGMMVMIFPPLGATGWAILEWDQAKFPIAMNIFSLVLLSATGFIP